MCPYDKAQCIAYIFKNSLTSLMERSDGEIDGGELIKKQDNVKNNDPKPISPEIKPKPAREVPEEAQPKTAHRRSAERDKKKGRSRNRRNSAADSFQKRREGSLRTSDARRKKRQEVELRNGVSHRDHKTRRNTPQHTDKRAKEKEETAKPEEKLPDARAVREEDQKVGIILHALNFPGKKEGEKIIASGQGKEAEDTGG